MSSPLFNFLAVSQISARPAIYADLIARLADFKRLLLGLHSLGTVDIVDAIGEPNAAVAAIFLDCVNGFACGFTLHALGSHLPAGLVPDNLAMFEGQTVIVGELENRTNVNHVVIPFRFVWVFLPLL